jgi:Tfp pilus assembly protein PilX
MRNLNYKSPNKITLNQNGMASILVVLIMSVVITLIVLGFSQVSTREQSNALETQLSTTAYYAAESGINDAINAIKNNPNLPPSSYAKNTCGNPGGTSIYGSLYSGSSTNYSVLNSTSGEGNTSYSCLLINPSPNEIVTDVSSNSQILPIDSEGIPISSLNLTWNNPNPSTTSNPETAWSTTNSDCVLPTVSPQFKSSTTWNCGLSVLRIDLVPVAAGQINENDLLTNTMSAFILPNNAGSASGIAFAQNSTSGNYPIYGSYSCSTTGCKASINIPSNDKTTEFYMRINTIYGGSNVLNLSATGTNGAAVALSGVEYVIDSTGSSAGVLRRVQVAVPIIQATNIPGYAIQTTTDICKRFYIIPAGSPGDPDGTGPQPSLLGTDNTGDCSLYGY